MVTRSGVFLVWPMPLFCRSLTIEFIHFWQQYIHQSMGHVLYIPSHGLLSDLHFRVHINIFERSFIDKNPVYLSYKTVYTVFFFIFYLKHIFYYIKEITWSSILYSADIACIFVVLRNVGFRLDWYLHSSCYFIFTFLLFFFLI